MNKEDIQKTRQIIKQGDLEALKEAFNENYLGGGSLVKAAVLYYGKENFQTEILEWTDVKLLNEKEIYWINFYKSTDPNIGYNVSKGGLTNDLKCPNVTKNIPNEEIQKLLGFKKLNRKKNKLKQQKKKYFKPVITDVEYKTEIIPNYSFSISKNGIRKH